MVKAMWMEGRNPGDEYPPQTSEWYVVMACREMQVQMPMAQRAWRYQGGTRAEISLESFAGAKPIWLWSV